MSFTRCRLCSNKKAGSSEPAVVVFVARDLQSEDPGCAQSNPTWGIFLALSPVQKKQPAGYEFWPLLRTGSARCRREYWPVIARLHEALHLPRRRAPFAKKRGSSIRAKTRLAASTRARWRTGRTLRTGIEMRVRLDKQMRCLSRSSPDTPWGSAIRCCRVSRFAICRSFRIWFRGDKGINPSIPSLTLAQYCRGPHFH